MFCKKLFFLLSIILFSITNTALAAHNPSVKRIKTFKLPNGHFVRLYQNITDKRSCDASFYFVERGKRSKNFGSGSDEIKVSQNGDMIVISMPRSCNNTSKVNYLYKHGNVFDLTAKSAHKPNLITNKKLQEKIKDNIKVYHDLGNVLLSGEVDTKLYSGFVGENTMQCKVYSFVLNSDGKLVKDILEMTYDCSFYQVFYDKQHLEDERTNIIRLYDL